MRSKSFTRSIAALSFSLLFLIAAFARPASAQSDQAASPDKAKPPVSKLSVSPTTLSYSVDIDKGKFTEAKHFNIANKGTLPMTVTVCAARMFFVVAPKIDAGGIKDHVKITRVDLSLE
jgi:hypothetical protein